MTLGNCFSKFAESTSIHGILYAYRAKTRSLQVFWTVLFLTMIACSIFLSVKTIQKYLNNPIYTREYWTTEREMRIKVPDVVFCFEFDKFSLSLLPEELSPFQLCPPYFYFSNTAVPGGVESTSTCNFSMHIWYGTVLNKNGNGHLQACYRYLN